MDRLDMLEAITHAPDALGLIEALKQIPNEIEAEIAGLSEETLRHRPSDGEWSIKEVVGHLRDNAEMWEKRLFMVYSQADPVLPALDQDEAVRKANYQEADLQAVFAGLREQSLKIVALLNRAPDWSRVGQHPVLGRRSLRQFAERVLAHGRAHLEQIRALRQAQDGR